MAHSHDLSELEIAVLNVLRRSHSPMKKSSVSEESDLPWSSTCRGIDSLIKRGMAKTNANKEIELVSEYGYFVGVSVGTSNVKICLYDFALNIVRKDFLQTFLKTDELKDRYVNFINNNKFEKYQKDDDKDYVKLCTTTPTQNIHALTTLINDILKFAIIFHDAGLNILCCGLSFPGHVDNENNKIIESLNLNLNLKDFGLENIAAEEVCLELKNKGIEIYFEHNVKAAAIAEKEFNKDLKDFVLIYMGTGLGASYILNNQLFRGSNNLTGQLGHTKTDGYLDDDEKKQKESNPTTCVCGRKNCLEQLIRENVFKGYDLHDHSTEQLIEFLEENEKKRNLFAKCISNSIYNLVFLLGIKQFIIAGRLPPLYKTIDLQVKSNLMNEQCNNYSIHRTAFGEFSAAVGAAVCAYYKYYNIPFIWKR